MNDWKDALSQLREGLPEGDVDSMPIPGQPEQNKGKKEKLNISLEKKGRGGKTATIIYGFTSDDDEIAGVAKILKQKLGIGGSSRGGEILLQGDVREKVKPLLKSLGYA